MRLPAVQLPCLAVLAVAVLSAHGGDAPAIHTVDGERPAVLDALGPLDDLVALALTADGTRAAAALRPAGSEGPTSLRLAALGQGEPTTLEVPGILRALVFPGTGGVLYAIEHKPAKKREGDTWLLRIDTDDLDAHRVLRLPSSAHGLDHWAAERSLLVACRHEIRTLVLPDLRSGPLFRIPGENLAVASLGGSRILVGRADALLLVDLADPQGRLEMPVRERAETPAAVVALVGAADGSSALARLADGTLHRVRLAPLALEPAGAGFPVARLRPSEPEPPMERPAAPPPRLPEAPEPPPPPPPPSPSPSPPPPPPAPPKEPEVRDDRPAPPAERPLPPPVKAASTGDNQVEGRVVGSLQDVAVHVVLLGPNHLLHEAARVRPSPDGRWSASGLAPGRYRVQLDGGPGTVLVTEPAFVVLDIAAGERVEAPDLTLVRALGPARPVSDSPE